MRVLLVDDDAAALEIRTLVLQRHGFEVFTAATAEGALASFETHRPDCVVMDLRIPEAEDGFSLIREFQGAKIVVLCGNVADLDHRNEAKLVSTILRKPAPSQCTPS